MLQRSNELKSAIFKVDTDNEEHQGYFVDVMETPDAYKAYLFKPDYDFKMLISDVPKILDDADEEVTPKSFMIELNKNLSDESQFTNFISKYLIACNQDDIMSDEDIDFSELNDFDNFEDGQTTFGFDNVDDDMLDI